MANGQLDELHVQNRYAEIEFEKGSYLDVSLGTQVHTTGNGVCIAPVLRSCASPPVGPNAAFCRQRRLDPLAPAGCSFLASVGQPADGGLSCVAGAHAPVTVEVHFFLYFPVDNQGRGFFGSFGDLILLILELCAAASGNSGPSSGDDIPHTCYQRWQALIQEGHHSVELASHDGVLIGYADPYFATTAHSQAMLDAAHSLSPANITFDYSLHVATGEPSSVPPSSQRAEPVFLMWEPAAGDAQSKSHTRVYFWCAVFVLCWIPIIVFTGGCLAILAKD